MSSDWGEEAAEEALNVDDEERFGRLRKLLKRCIIPSSSVSEVLRPSEDEEPATDEETEEEEKEEEEAEERKCGDVVFG